MSDAKFEPTELAHADPRVQAYLIKIIEEAAEVQHIAAKALLWGLDSFNPLKPTDGDNFIQLLNEFDDLSGRMDQLKELVMGPVLWDDWAFPRISWRQRLKVWVGFERRPKT